MPSFFNIVSVNDDLQILMELLINSLYAERILGANLRGCGLQPAGILALRDLLTFQEKTDYEEKQAIM